MSARIKQLAKILTSGILFSFLAVGGGLSSLLIRPVLALLPGGKEARRRRAERVIRSFFRSFVFGLKASGILSVETVDLPSPEALAGAIVLANHYSYLDIVILIALLPDSVCVVKEAIWNNPFFGGIVRASGFIPNGDPEDVLAWGGQALARGKTLVIFPEGTRSMPGQPFKFHRGAAHLALQAGAPIFPFVITVDPPLLAKGDRWYHIPAPTCAFHISCRPWIHCGAPAAAHPAQTRHARQLTLALQGHYEKAMHEPDRVSA